jgi:Aminoglycoside-2''-adenylyltransferase
MIGRSMFSSEGWPMPVEAADVHELLDVLAGAGVAVILCGGWGVDALVGE